MVFKIWGLLLLLIIAIVDIRHKCVYVVLCAFHMIAGIIISIIFQNKSIIELILVFMAGVVIYSIAILSKEAIGKGDALVIATAGEIAGGAWMIKMFIFALVLCSVFSILGIVSRKLVLKSHIAFVPFLFLGGILATAL